MGRPLKIKKTATKDIGYNNKGSLTAPDLPISLTDANFVGVVGGTASPSASYPVVQVTINVDAGTGVETGKIVRQKGTTSYLVIGDTSGVTAKCTLVNDTTPAINEMCIQMAANSDSSLITVKKLSNKWALDYSDNRYLVNFFSDEGTTTISGRYRNATTALAQVENATS